MKKLLALTIVCAFVVTGAGVAGAAFSTAPGYTATELYDTAGSFTTIGGLDLDSGYLYFGQYTDIKSLDLSDNSTAVVGTVPGTQDSAH